MDDTPKGATLARQAAMLCELPAFGLYLDQRRRWRQGLSPAQLPDGTHTPADAADALREHGASSVMACCSHPVLSGPAIERIHNSSLSKVLVTDTIPLQPEALQCDKFEVVSVAPLLAQAIWNIHRESSVSTLFT